MQRKRGSWRFVIGAALFMLVWVAVPVVSHAVSAPGYTRTDLVADTSGVATFTDPNLVNAWGVIFGLNGVLYVSDNGTGVSTLYRGDGKSVSPVISIPGPGGTGSGTPTGVVENITRAFMVSSGGNSGPARFLYATEDGTIAGWNPTVSATAAVLGVDNSSTRAVYKGLAISLHRGGRLYAADFHNGKVDVFNRRFNLVGSFTDTGLPSGFAPFGIRNIKGHLFVTFALQKPPDNRDDQAGPGNGYVDEFDLEGNLVRHFGDHAPLNSPWGLALAPDEFGPFANALIVGNFGDGTIHAYNVDTGELLGELRDASDNPIVIDGLWGLSFGIQLFDLDRDRDILTATNVLYFAAGPGDESHGLLGMIRPVR